MPQLDFFTFPHQYLIASICFCGVYYFNLLILFPRIKYLYLSKIFSINSIFINNSLFSLNYLNVIIQILLEELVIISIFFKKNWKLQKKFFLKKISFVKIYNATNNNNNLIINQFVFFLLCFFFFKNFIIFNAEKLMLIYFLIISFLIFSFVKVALHDYINKDIKKFIQLIIEIENYSNESLKILISYLLKLKINFITNTREQLLLKNLEIKAVKRIKW